MKIGFKLALLFMLLVPAAFVRGASAANVDSREAAELIGVLTDGKISFPLQSDSAVSRKTFITNAVELFAADEAAAESVGFSDVSSDDELFAVLCKAVGMGIISDGDFFRPDDGIAAAEAAKILCTVMGYKARAEALGGYPGGYLKTAKDVRLFDGAGGTINAEAEARLLYNALLNGMSEETAYTIGTGGKLGTKYDGGKNENLLGKLYDVSVTEGRVNANEYSVLGSDGSENEKCRYEIDGVPFKLCCESGNALLGYNVRAYYREQSAAAAGEIIFAYPVKNTVVAAAAYECEYNKSGGSIYLTKEKKTISLNAGFDCIYNGKAFYGYGDELIPKNGTIELIDCDNDGLYDVVSVHEVYYMTVSTANAVYKTISDKFDSIKSLDLSGDKCSYSIFDEDGGSLPISEIAEDMVFAVEASKDKSLVIMHLCTESIGGIYESIDKDAMTVRVDGEEYRLDSDFEDKYINSIRLGEKYTFGLGINGEIISFGENKGGYHYGYIIRAALEGGIKKVLKLKLFTEDSKFEILECGENARLDSHSSSVEDIKAAVTNSRGETEAQLIRYRLDNDGKIANIDIARAGTEIRITDNDSPDDRLESFSGGAPWYFRHNIFYPNFNANGATVFCVPSSTKYAEDENYYKIGHSFADGTYESTKIIPYNIGANGSAEIIVYKTNDATTVSADNNQGKIMMVEKVVTGVDKDGSWLRKIIGWQNGAFIEMFIDEDIAIHKSNGAAELEGGDVIRYAAADDKITALSVDFIAETLSRNTSADNTEVPQFNVRSSPNHYQAGSVYSVSGGYAYLYNESFSFDGLINAALPQKIALYDFETKKIRTVDASYLRTYISDGAGGGFMLIKQHYQNSEAGFFYINK